MCQALMKCCVLLDAWGLTESQSMPPVQLMALLSRYCCSKSSSYSVTLLLSFKFISEAVRVLISFLISHFPHLRVAWKLVEFELYATRLIFTVISLLFPSVAYHLMYCQLSFLPCTYFTVRNLLCKWKLLCMCAYACSCICMRELVFDRSAASSW